MSTQSPTAILSIKNLSIAFGERMVVQGVTLDINRGETVAIIGESGSGKTVTALSVMRLLQGGATHPTGEIWFEGRDLLRASADEIQNLRGARISMMFQEPLTALNPLHRVLKQISEAITTHYPHMAADEAETRVDDLLRMVELHDADRIKKSFPHQLSGGQRQRVLLAMALANRPDVLILDEPTTAVDASVQQQILDMLMRLQNEFKFSMLVISHDFEVVKQLAQWVAVMKDGQVVEQGRPTQIFGYPKHPYTQQLLAAELQPRVINTSPAAACLSTNGLTVRYPAGGGYPWQKQRYFVALDHVNITLRRGRTLGVIGESGSGKTSLAMALLRLLKSSGDIVLGDTDFRALHGKKLRRARSRIQILFQDPFGSLNPRLTVQDIVGEGLSVHKKEGDHAVLIQEALRDVGLPDDILHRFPHEFSGGQRQRIALARALILRPDILILDEPTSALDRSVQKQIVALLQDVQQNYNLAYMLISHDPRVVRAMADEVIVLKNGRVVTPHPEGAEILPLHGGRQ